MNKLLLKKNRLFFIISIFIFLVILSANILTPLISDDYAYCFSFATGERIKSLSEILPSMIAHRETMNGRVVAHFMVQAFLMFPKWVFNIVNSFAFVLETILICLYAKGKDNNLNPMLLICVFASIWIFQPSFGQVNLWLDGSCNYLWATNVMLLFFYPYYNLHFLEKSMSRTIQLLFILFSPFAGAFSENGSAAAIAMSALIIVLRLFQKKNSPLFLWLSLFFAFAGYCAMVFVPATASNERLNFTFSHFLTGITYCTAIFADYSVLFFFSFIITIYFITKKRTKEIILPLIMMLGSFLSLYMLAFVKFQSSRRGCHSMILMLISLCILVQKMDLRKTAKKLYSSVIFIMISLFIVFSFIGFKDIIGLYEATKANNTVIYECKKNNISPIKIKFYTGQTKYAANNDLFYYPDFMARYYEVPKIED